VGTQEDSDERNGPKYDIPWG